MKLSFLLVPLLLLALPTLTAAAVDCVTLPNAISNNGTDACTCFMGFAWNGTACAPPSGLVAPAPAPASPTPTTTTNCSTVRNAIGTNPSGGCNCMVLFVWTPPNCVIDCTQVSNSVHIPQGVDSCVCAPGYTWSKETLLCVSAPSAPSAPSSGTASLGTPTPTTPPPSTISAPPTSTPNPTPSFVSTPIVTTTPTVVSTPLTFTGTATPGSTGTVAVIAVPVAVVSSSPSPPSTSSISVPGASTSTNGATVPSGSVSTLNNFGTSGGFQSSGTIPTANTTPTTFISPENISNILITNSPTPVWSTGTSSATNLPTGVLGINNPPRTATDGSAVAPTTTSSTGTGLPTVGLPFTNPQPSSALDCRTVMHSTGENFAPNSCACQSGYTWMTANNTCIPNSVLPTLATSINCTLIPGTVGVQADKITCKCQSGFLWTGSVCVRDCNKMKHSTGQNLNNMECFCDKQSRWEGGICMENCKDRPFTIGNDKVSGDCQCLSSFAMINGSCRLSCQNVLYSQSKLVSGKLNECKCKSTYRWESKIFQCVSQNDNSDLAIGLGLGLGIPLGIMALAGLGYLIYKCRQPKVVVPPTKTERTIAAPSATTVMETERALKPAQSPIYPPQTNYQYAPRGEQSGGMLPPPSYGAGLPSQGNIQTSMVMAGPPQFSGVLPNQSQLGVVTTTTQRTVVEPISTAYNGAQAGLQAMANDAYNTANQGFQGAYNGVQTSAQNMYGQARDGINSAAASVGRRVTGS